ncbi:MAG: hypothetical protein EBR32_02065 [Bacteroidetes bacterium]|jgi:heme exporter protein B|nr:hypothetical protein [Bacteroidota bacterium]
MMMRHVFTVFKKDLRVEFRTKYALNMVAAFIVASLLLILFTLKAQELDPTPKSGLIWIVVLFASLTVLGRSFILETDRGTFQTLQIYADPSSVYLGKFLYNLSFSWLIYALSFGLYGFLIKWSIVSYSAFFYIMIFGTMGLSSVCTLIAAIVSQADRQGAIFSVLSIPLFVPFILLLSRLTKRAFVDGLELWWNSEIAALVGFVGVTSIAGWLLFDFIWEED